jgi:hypothetical protein
VDREWLSRSALACTTRRIGVNDIAVDAAALAGDEEVMKAFHMLYGRGVLSGAMYEKLIDQHNERIRQIVDDEVWR